MKRLNETIALIKRILRHVERKHLPLVAAGLAYYFLMSLFPALILLTAIAAYLPVQNGMQGAVSFLAYLIPRQGISLIQDLLTTITPHRTGLLSFGLITTLWLASIGAKGIISGVDIVYEIHAPRPLWINRILAVGLTFAVGALLVLGFALMLLGPALLALLSTAVPVESLWLKIGPYVQWFLAALFTFGGIEVIYLLAPNVPAACRSTIPGALVATLMWMALSWGLGFYFHYFGQWKLEKFYGVLATPMAFMVWLYWGAAAILIGAEINSSLLKLKMSDSRETSSHGPMPHKGPTMS